MIEVPKRGFVSPPNEVHRALQQDVVLGEDGDPDAGQDAESKADFQQVNQDNAGTSQTLEQ